MLGLLGNSLLLLSCFYHSVILVVKRCRPEQHCMEIHLGDKGRKVCQVIHALRLGQRDVEIGQWTIVSQVAHLPDLVHQGHLPPMLVLVLMTLLALVLRGRLDLILAESPRELVLAWDLTRWDLFLPLTLSQF